MKKALTVASLALIVLVIFTSLNINHTAGFDRAINVIKALAGLGTFIIALLLFDKFGLRKDLKSRQFDLVLELAEIVKGMSVHAKSLNSTYIINFTPNRSKDFINSSLSEQYECDKLKKIVVDPSDYKDGLEKLLNYQKKTLLPGSIKLVISEFDYLGYTNLAYENYNTDSHIFISFKGKTKASERELGSLLSGMNFEKFNLISENLASTIQKWILEHSEDEIDIFSPDPIIKS